MKSAGARARRAGASGSPPRGRAARARARSRRRARRRRSSRSSASAVESQARSRGARRRPGLPRSPRCRRRARSSSSSSSSRVNGLALGGRLHLDEPAVRGHDDVHVRLGGRVLGVVEVEQRRRPSTMPTETAATAPASAFESPKRSSARAAATYAPEIAAQRVPPSAWSTSQSSQSVRSPSALEVDDRRERASDQPLDLDRAPALLAPAPPRAPSRSPVEAGSSEYSAVIQPRPGRWSQRGTPSSTVAVQSTRVFPWRVEDDAVRVLEAVREQVEAPELVVPAPSLPHAAAARASRSRRARPPRSEAAGSARPSS